MTDSRIDKLARILVNYSLQLKDGDLFMINAIDLAAPLVRSVFYEALLAGAHPSLKINLDGIAEILYKTASENQLKYISDIQKLEVEKVDAMLTVLGTYNTRNLSNVDPDRVAVQQKAGMPLRKRFLERIAEKKLRWCATQFPTQATAQEADMSLSEYEDFLFDACAVDVDDPVGHWLMQSSEQDRIIAFLKNVDHLHIKGVDTDLKLRVKDRIWINCAGHENFPDGEIFTAPLEDSVEGSIRFSWPAIYHGREVQDVRLTFDKGQVVKAEASKGMEFLKSMLETDEGSSFVGEFAFGMNKGIKQFTKNTLFDEKIGGTIHLALGTSLPESGGKNQSAIHWDMVCDMRAGGDVSADGEVIYEQGEFIL